MAFYDGNVTSIFTARLELRHLPQAFLEATAAGRVMELDGLSIPDDWWQERAIAAWRAADMRADAGYRPWSLRAIVESATGVMAGFCGFHTAPDPPYLEERDGGVELAYSVFPPFRRRGFATEAAEGMMDWACAEHGVRQFVVSIDPENEASMRVASKLGFVQVGQHMDPVDGLEFVYLRRVDDANWNCSRVAGSEREPYAELDAARIGSGGKAKRLTGTAVVAAAEIERPGNVADDVVD